MFCRFIDNINKWVGRSVAFLAFPMCVVIIYEVIARHIFNSPTIWAHELSEFLLVTYIYLGGGYALLYKAHVNVDILHGRFAPKAQAITDLCTSVFLFIFLGVMLWAGWDMGLTSLLRLENSMTQWHPPIYPIKIVVPIAVFLMVLQGVAKFIRDFTTAVGTGEQSER